MKEHKFIASGRTADVLVINNQEVLKLFKSEISEETIRQEFAVSQQVYELGIACPAPIKITEYQDRKGIIYSRVHGMSMLKIIFKNMWSVNKELARMARIHLNLHKHCITHLPKQKDNLTACIIQAPLLTQTEKQQIIDHLNQLKEDTKLCHGDYHPDNIILSAQNEWIIDWMTGMAGNPAGDVARTYIILKFGRLSERTPRLLSNIASHVRNHISKQYLTEYLKHAEINKEEIEDWLLPVAAARLTEWIPSGEKEELVTLIRKRKRQ